MLRVNSHPKYGLLQLEIFNYVNDIFRLKFTPKNGSNIFKNKKNENRLDRFTNSYPDSFVAAVSFWSIVVAMFLRINMDFNECLVFSIAIFSRNLNKINEL